MSSQITYERGDGTAPEEGPFSLEEENKVRVNHSLRLK